MVERLTGKNKRGRNIGDNPQEELVERASKKSAADGAELATQVIDSIKSHISEIIEKKKNSKLGAFMKQHANSTRRGSITLSSIRRKSGRGEYNNLDEIFQDIDTFLKNICEVKDCPLDEFEILRDDLTKIMNSFKKTEAFQDVVQDVPEEILLPRNKSEKRDLDGLFYLAEREDVETMVHLLKINPRLSRMYQKTKFSGKKIMWSALHMSAYHGKTKSVEALLKNGANVEDKDTLYSSGALCWAASNNQVDLCKLLIEKYKADESCRNSNGQTAFDLLQCGSLTTQNTTEFSGDSDKANSDSQKSSSKTALKILIRSDKNSQVQKQQREPSGASTANSNRPSLRLKFTPVKKKSPQPVKKVIIKFPKVQAQDSKPVEEPLKDSSEKSLDRRYRIILRPRSLQDNSQPQDQNQKVTANDQVPQNEFYENIPKERSPYEGLKYNACHKPMQTVPHTAINHLQDRNILGRDTFLPSMTTISSSRFVNALKDLKKTLVVSVGIVSERNMVRMIFPIKGFELWTGISLNLNSKINSLSVRLLMIDFEVLKSLIKEGKIGFDIGNAKPSYTVSATQITKHFRPTPKSNVLPCSYIRLKALPLVSNGPYTHDCCMVLEPGLNILELNAAAAIPESFEAINQKIELFIMRT